MKIQPLLKKFEYSIPVPTIFVSDKLQTIGFAGQSSIFKLKIDFPAGIMHFEGNRKYIKVTNFHKRSYLVHSNSGLLKIETEIFPATTINLNDPETDGMIFPMEGHVESANCLVPCAGFLAIDNVTAGKKYWKDLWNITCFIYDIQFTDFEIYFKLPLSHNIP